MNIFTFFALMGGLSAITAYVFGTRAMVRDGAIRSSGTSWTWHGVFTFFVFMTILSAPLSR